MKRLTGIEMSAIALGLLFVIVGASMIVYPGEGIVFHPAPPRYGVLLGPNQPEHVSKRRSQIYGGIAVVIGIGITWLAFYRGRK
jgi:hypothetical protein